MKAILKRIVPPAHRARLRRLIDGMRDTALGIRLTEMTAWRSAADRTHPMSNTRADTKKRLLIIPCDPFSVTGSRGDQAMIEAAVGRLRLRADKLHVGIVTGTAEGAAKIRAQGYEALQIFGEPFSYIRASEEICRFAPDWAFAIGADVVDGYYSAVSAARMLLLSDLAARSGAHVSVLGFSFNNHPKASLRQVFAALHDKVRLHARDPISERRFRAFSNRSVELVADAAFMLQPAIDMHAHESVTSWISARRAAGDIIVVYNIHPLLFKNADAEIINKISNISIDSIVSVSKKHKVSWLFLPHDDRPNVGDGICLAPIAKGVGTLIGDRAYYIDVVPTAPEIKAMVGAVDGAATGRMHLAIACLGRGVPVMGLTYQDKFHGLFEHFGLDDRGLLSPSDLLEPGKLTETLDEFIGTLDVLRARVEARREHVSDLALKNLAQFK